MGAGEDGVAVAAHLEVGQRAESGLHGVGERPLVAGDAGHVDERGGERDGVGGEVEGGGGGHAADATADGHASRRRPRDPAPRRADCRAARSTPRRTPDPAPHARPRAARPTPRRPRARAPSAAGAQCRRPALRRGRGATCGPEFVHIRGQLSTGSTRAARTAGPAARRWSAWTSNSPGSGCAPSCSQPDTPTTTYAAPPPSRRARRACAGAPTSRAVDERLRDAGGAARAGGARRPSRSFRPVPVVSQSSAARAARPAGVGHPARTGCTSPATGPPAGTGAAAPARARHPAAAGRDHRGRRRAGHHTGPDASPTSPGPMPFEQAVAVADARSCAGPVDPDELRRRGGASRAGARQRPTRRRAIAFADAGAESVGESRSRVLLARARLPPPVLQWEVPDPRTRIGRTDFAWPELRTVGEFDGRVKYGRLLRPGQEPGDVVFAEKRREDAHPRRGSPRRPLDLGRARRLRRRRRAAAHRVRRRWTPTMRRRRDASRRPAPTRGVRRAAGTAPASRRRNDRRGASAPPRAGYRGRP